MSGKTITSFRAREPVPREGNGRDWLRSDETEGETVETYDLSSWLVLICIRCLFRDIRKQVTHHIFITLFNSYKKQPFQVWFVNLILQIGKTGAQREDSSSGGKWHNLFF